MKFRLILFCTLITQIIYSQSYKISGKITDKSSGEELIGAAIFVLGTNNGTITDFEGNYELSNIESGSKKIICQYISYQNDTIEVNINQDLTLNFELISDSYTISAVELITKVDRKDESYVVNVQKKAVGMINTLSKKQMNVTGVSNAADAVKNVSGVNVQGGKYVFVRGLSDRYSLATLNGIAIPSLDPNKNSVQMDLIPSNVIDNILVFKTFTPDLPGNFTGGMVDVYTSDFPDSLEISFKYSTGYSNLSNLNDNFLGQQSSSTDWLGYDDGSRDIPNFVLENGINNYSGSSFEEAFYYAQSQDPEYADMSLEDVQDANGNFNGWTDRWFWIEQSRVFANDSLTIASNSFSKDWDPIRFKSGLNQSFNFSVGNKYVLNRKEIGFNSGISYNKRYTFYENAEFGRFKQTGVDSETLIPQKTGLESRGDENIFGSIFTNTSLKFENNHKLSLMAMLNQSGQSSARYFDGENMSDAVGLYEEQRTQRYLERQMQTAQLSGEHNFEGDKTSELKWNLGITKSKQNTPDLRVFTNSYEFLTLEDDETGDFYLDTIPTYSIQANLYPAPTRYYRYLDENNINFKSDYKLNINEEDFVKAGFYYLSKSRENIEYRYTFMSQGVDYNNNLDDYFDSSNMIVGQSNNGLGGQGEFINVIDNTEIKNNYIAEQKILSSYLMSTLHPNERIEITFGARFENAEILATSADTAQDVGELNNNDILPAFNTKFSIDENTHLRASYSKTLARPSFREIAPISWYDFETTFQFVGNPNLQRTMVTNIDLRLEKYTSGAGLLSISGFYKMFKNPIEQVMNPQAQNVELSWRNVDEASLIGIEFEAKKKFVFNENEYLNIGFNTSLIKSETKIDSLELELIRAFDPNHPETRPMFGQSPYIINFYSQYQKNKWSLGANFNVSGKNIVIVQKGAVDVYQAPQPMLNIKLSHQILDNSTLSLSARNLLSARNRWYYPFNGQEYAFRDFFYAPQFNLSLQLNL